MTWFEFAYNQADRLLVLAAFVLIALVEILHRRRHDRGEFDD